eukprot:1161566-Pelagomonas_calceolata.AAC.7
MSRLYLRKGRTAEHLDARKCKRVHKIPIHSPQPQKLWLAFTDKCLTTRQTPQTGQSVYKCTPGIPYRSLARLNHGRLSSINWDA